MYKILTAPTASELNKQIESHIQDEWSVVGSHQVVVIHEQNRFAGTQHKDTIVEREYSISVVKTKKPINTSWVSDEWCEK